MIGKRVSLLLKRNKLETTTTIPSFESGAHGILKSSNFSKIRLELVHLNIKLTVYCSFATESRHNVLSCFASTIFEATSFESMISERTQIYLWITIYSSGSKILFCQPFKLLVTLHMCASECEQSCLCAG
ncbi:hypothetical protein BRADI_3g46313v3 [Brachypodium distachyon]|uniref:Uncharacterized protein n=1 Tax=Brachypodium distachyon TaxID=15368 RepID=A0A2K2D3L0_BRADI|nr:hypothetical protein BRADI_3g46313v3 [Brachypodium distachyon]